MLAARHADTPFRARLVRARGSRGFSRARASASACARALRRLRSGAHAPAAGTRRGVASPARRAGGAGPSRSDQRGDACSTCCATPRDACATGAFDALVTAPVQKSMIKDAGIPFTGHTEYLAERTRTPRVVMLLVGGTAEAPLRVALVDHAPDARRRARGDHARQRSSETLTIVDRGLARRSSASRARASRSAGSIRTPAKAGTSGARRST